MSKGINFLVTLLVAVVAVAVFLLSNSEYTEYINETRNKLPPAFSFLWIEEEKVEWPKDKINELDPKAAISDVLWAVTSSATTRDHLDVILSTWYELLPPENFLLVLGVHHADSEGGLEKNSAVAKLLKQKLHRKSLFVYPCGAERIKSHHCCKTGTALSVGMAVLNGSFKEKSDISRLKQASNTRREPPLGDKFRKDIISTRLPVPKLTINYKLKKNPPQWLCVFNDIEYVHVDRLAQFLQTQDPSANQIFAPFCTIGRKLTLEYMNDETGLSELPPGTMNQTCDLYCLSRATLLNETTFPPKVFNQAGFPAMCNSQPWPEDVVLGWLTKGIKKNDVSCMLSVSDIVESNCPKHFANSVKWDSDPLEQKGGMVSVTIPRFSFSFSFIFFNMSRNGRIEYYPDCGFIPEDFKTVGGGMFGAVQSYHKGIYPNGRSSLEFSDGLCMMRRPRDVCSHSILNLLDNTVGCLKYVCMWPDREELCKEVLKDLEKRKGEYSESHDDYDDDDD